MLLRNKYIAVMLVFLALIWVTGCSDDDGVALSALLFEDFKVTVQNVATAYDYGASGAAAIPVGGAAAGPIGPGGAYEAAFSAPPGSKLSFATMFVPSNDLFYGPDGMGIDLYDNAGAQVTGDVTAEVMLWDAGSEINQEPGLGPDQPQRQAGPDTGAPDPNNLVRLAPDDFLNLPAVASVIRVTLTATPPTEFMLRVENVSDATTLTTSDTNQQAVPLAPVAWVVHTDNNPLFTSGQADYGEGLATLAEDGDPSGLAGSLANLTGVTHILAPGVWAVHRDSEPLFSSAQSDYGMGLEALAEDGDPSGLADALAAQDGIADSGAFTTPVGASGPGPLFPGGTYEFSIRAAVGEKLSFATMLVQSNDLFYAGDDMGVPLFDGDAPVSGDITDRVALWDAGTEINEPPGLGLNQAPRQAGPDTGADENGLVRMVDDGYTYPAVNSVIKVTLAPQ